MLLAGKYRLEQPLGHGGMGTVYRAVDVSLDRQVAVKVLHASLAGYPELVARFEREARLMARLDHPNLVPIYAVEKNEDTPYIVMKLLDGQTLRQTSRSRARPFRPNEVTPLLQQICAGLGFMHARGIVHRDLKPGNLVIGPDGHVTILDLGVARDVDTGLTRPGEWIGTPLYMSPEQTMGTTMDPRSDLYSLGVIVYEMLTGKPPFIGENELETMRAHREGPIPDVASTSGTSRAISDVLAKVLAKAPESRFANAEELLAAWNAAVRAPAEASDPSEETPLENPRATPPSRPAAIASSTTVLRPSTPAPTKLSPTRLKPSELPDDSLAPLADVEVPARKDDPDRTVAPPPAEAPRTVAEPRTELPPPPRRSGAARWAALAGVVVAALAVGALAMLYFMQPPVRPPPPQPVVAERGPEPTPVRDDPSPPPGAPDPAPEEKEEKAEPTPAKPARPRTGELRVVVVSGDKSTWGDVKVDGVARGYAPATLQVSAGVHDVTVTRGGVVLTKKAKVTGGGTTVLKFEVRE